MFKTEVLFTKELPRVKIEVVAKHGLPECLQKQASCYREGFFQIGYTFKLKESIHRVGRHRSVDILIPHSEDLITSTDGGFVIMHPEEVISDARHRITVDDRTWTDEIIIEFTSLTTRRKRYRLITLTPLRR